MELAKALIQVPQTERGGEIAQRGLDFQACWALSHMLEYELEGKEYVFVFEYHDDVLILDSEFNPQKVIFAQVKTNEKPWTLSKLISSTKEKPISFIGKLFEHRSKFVGSNVELMFVSNAYFNFDERNRFSANELKEAHKENIVCRVSEQVISSSKLELSKLIFLTSDLSLEGHASHLKGKICDFFENYFHEEMEINPALFARTLESACRDRAKVRSSDIKDFDELIKRKGFTSTFLKDTLRQIKITKLLQPTWQYANPIFCEVGKGAFQLLSLQATFSRVSIALKQTNSAERIYLEKASALFDKQRVEESITLYIMYVIESLKKSVPEYSLALTDEQKECLVVYSIIKITIGDEGL
ncbi:DUF4297 domain-containing protein [Halomonas sp. QHL1]|uniref:DUF4297 domain-containing protein n=1 Tax=Halomonas sp. QHL1 TaxID=1123773 RepID=UPI0008FCF227|nr:DUF4297 domain-containing protein [Halomonas sp. QHL1]OJA07216.1 hypothetical protein QHL1GM_18375 [Halomonas sp. QHL1]